MNEIRITLSRIIPLLYLWMNRTWREFNKANIYQLNFLISSNEGYGWWSDAIERKQYWSKRIEMFQSSNTVAFSLALKYSQRFLIICVKIKIIEQEVFRFTKSNPAYPLIYSLLFILLVVWESLYEWQSLFL